MISLSVLEKKAEEYIDKHEPKLYTECDCGSPRYGDCSICEGYKETAEFIRILRQHIADRKHLQEEELLIREELKL